METRKILTILVLALGLMVWAAGSAEAEPMGTAFTYQGRLIDANSTADGLYDFAFKLYDANVAGSKVGTDVNVPDVDVTDGYFTVELDFGAGVFDGNGVWLETGVRPGQLEDPNGYTTLSPRQEVTPTPYALYALQARQAEQLALPYSGEVSSSPTSFLVRNTGSGKAIQGIGENNDGVTGASYAPGRSGVFGYNDDANGFGVFGSSINGIGVKGYTFGDAIAGYFEIANPSSTSSALHAMTNGTGNAGYFLLNNAGSSGSSIYALTIGNGNGVYGLSTGLTGRGVKGYASNNGAAVNYGGYFKAAGRQGMGIYAEAAYPGEEVNEVTYGGYFKSASRYGAAVYAQSTHSYGGKGVYGNASGDAGIGVYGQTSGNINGAVYGVCTNATSGKGVYGTASGNTGVGVMGAATNSGSYTNYGGYFTAAGSSGRGVYGKATGSNGVGVYGEATGGGKAGHFEGDVHVKGDITKEYVGSSTTSNHLAAPIAYAFINSGGTVASGTPNVSCSWNGTSQRYEVTIYGESYYYNNYVTVITLSGTTGVVKTSSVGGKLLVYIYNLSGTAVQSDFQFVTYKP